MATAWLRKKGQKAAKPSAFHPYMKQGSGGSGIRLTKHSLGWLATAMGAVVIEGEREGGGSGT